MLILLVLFFGLAAGSFVNALVWRVHEQAEPGLRGSKARRELPIANGRSVCPHCRHRLAVKDLVPLFSWLWLRGRCRYCSNPIGLQYPLVELLTAALFTLSYLCWPYDVNGSNTLVILQFASWLFILTGLVALAVYDLRWMLLPNRILYPLIVLGAVFAVFGMFIPQSDANLLSNSLAVIVGGGIFYGIFQLSQGRWIGGGDVKLGFLLGFLAQEPFKAFLMLFIASLLGSTFALPAMLFGKVQARSRLPFGPFLIAAAIIVVLFGTGIIDWYRTMLLLDA